MSKERFEPRVMAFCCHYCAYAAADLAGTMRIQYPPNVRIIRTPCTGRLETEFLIKAFETTGDEDTVGSIFKGLHKEFCFEPAGAGGADDADVRRILDAHRAGQIRRGIRTVVAAKGQNFRFKNV